MSLETRANDFDRLVGELQFQRAAGDFFGDRVLDVGCGTGEFTCRLHEHFKSVVGIDADPDNIRESRQAPNTEYHTSTAEAFQNEHGFSTILMMDILEHVENPVEVLKHLKTLLIPGNGRIIIQVPNAYSFNRMLGKAMGLIDEVHKLSTSEVERFGHKRVYDPDSLQRDVRAASLVVMRYGGILFKPFTNDQMEAFLEDKTGAWCKSFMEGCATVGYHFPRHCAKIFVIATI